MSTFGKCFWVCVCVYMSPKTQQVVWYGNWWEGCWGLERRGEESKKRYIDDLIGLLDQFVCIGFDQVVRLRLAFRLYRWTLWFDDAIGCLGQASWLDAADFRISRSTSLYLPEIASQQKSLCVSEEDNTGVCVGRRQMCFLEVREDS